MSEKRLFWFGYESPEDFRINSGNGTDFESSTGVWIISSSEQDAMKWGQTIAERFLIWLFEREGQSPYSWINGNYACWIETDPGRFTSVEKLAIVSIGEMPDFTRLCHDA